MQAAAAIVDPLPGLLREWAEWFERAASAGYSDSTVLWRAVMGPGSGEFKSSPPVGLWLLEIHGELAQVNNAIIDLFADPDTKRPIEAIVLLYVFGPIQAMERWGGSKTKFYEAIRTGEILIKREIKR